jgi:hypothetical protein
MSLSFGTVSGQSFHPYKVFRIVLVHFGASFFDLPQFDEVCEFPRFTFTDSR